MTVATRDPAAPPTIVRKGPERVDFPVLSPGGGRVAFQMMTRDDWEIVVVNRDGTGETRVTRDIQHDVLPQFLTETRLVGMIGEPRHRRSFLYDLQTGIAHAPVSQQHRPHDRAGVLLGHQPRRQQDAARRRARRRHGLARARRLPDGSRAHGDAARNCGRASPRAWPPRKRCAPRARGSTRRSPRRSRRWSPRRRSRESTATRKRSSTSTRSTSAQPGNKLASAYLFETYKSFGYAPEFQWFERANALGGQTANVIATLKGTVNPELIYVVSSHYDSVAIGPGRRRRFVGDGGAARDGPDHGEAAAAGDDRLRLVHRRGSGPARQPRVRAAGRRRQAVDRRRAQQRHGRLGQRSAPRQHDPVLEPRASATSSTRRRSSSPTSSPTTRSTTRAPTRPPTTTPSATSSAASVRIRS